MLLSLAESYGFILSKRQVSTGKIIEEYNGKRCAERFSPCSSFKIAAALQLEPSDGNSSPSRADGWCVRLRMWYSRLLQFVQTPHQKHRPVVSCFLRPNHSFRWLKVCFVRDPHVF